MVPTAAASFTTVSRRLRGRRRHRMALPLDQLDGVGLVDVFERRPSHSLDM
jgi:hypothetical protein